MKVVSKQKNSKTCFICGMYNPAGVRAHFYNMEDGSVMTKFRFRQDHQSYPRRVHGGIISAMLDELACRAYWAKDDSVLAVTMSMEVKFRKPVPYDEDLIGKGVVYSDSRKFFKSKVEIRDKAGTLLANGDVVYIKLPADKIATESEIEKDMLYEDDNPVTEI